MKKKIKKAWVGSAIMGGVGLVSSVLASNEAQEQAAAARRLQAKRNFNDALVEQDVYDEEFMLNNVNNLPTYNKGGKLPTSTSSSTTGRYDAKGGDLIPISDNAEVVDGNTHLENTIDDSYGVTLSDNGEPVANVEDEEVIVDNDLVFSDTLEKDGKTFAEHALVINTKIGELQEKGKTLTRPNEKFANERTIQGLEKQNQELFMEQEAMKAEVTGGVEPMVDVENGVVDSPEDTGVPIARLGTSINKLNRKRFISDPITDTTKAAKVTPEELVNSIGEREHNTAKEIAPLVVDNLTNLLLTSNAPTPTAPTVRRAPIIDTTVNVAPQLADVNNTISANDTVISNNTNNSGVARANMTANNLKGLEARTSILSQKEQQERALRNQRSQVQTQTANTNAELQDNYVSEVMDNNVQRNTAYSQNISNLVEDYSNVKQTQAQKDNDDTLIEMSLLNDPTGEKSRYYARTGRKMTKEGKALLLQELKRIETINNNKPK